MLWGGRGEGEGGGGAHKMVTGYTFNTVAGFMIPEPSQQLSQLPRNQTKTFNQFFPIPSSIESFKLKVTFLLRWEPSKDLTLVAFAENYLPNPKVHNVNFIP